MSRFIHVTVLVLYMLFVLGIGVLAWYYTKKEPSDFYVAGKTVGTVVLAFTLLATILSAWTFFGVGASASGTGLGVYNFIGLEVIIFGLVFMTVGIRIARTGYAFDYLTPVEYLVDRYNSPGVGMAYLFIAFIFLLSFVMTQLIGGAVALEILAEIPFTWGVIIMAILMAVYIHIAGFRGVIWSDLVQGIVLFIVLVGLAAFAIYSIGPGELVAGVTAENPGLFDPVGPVGVWTALFTITFTWVFVIGVVCYPQIYQRFLSAKSPEVLMKSSLLFPLLGIPVFFSAIALGVWSVGVIPEPIDPDYVIPLLIQEITHPVITGIALAAGVAALMSTADSVILSLSSMFSRDIYKAHINENATGEQEVLVSQIMLVVIIVLAVLGALIRPAGIFDLGALAVYGHAVAAPTLLISLYWTGATKEGAIISMLVGGIIVLLFFFEFVPDDYALGMHWGFFALIISTVLFFAISYVTNAPPEEQTVRYIEDI